MAGPAIRDLPGLPGWHTKDGLRYRVRVKVCGVRDFFPGISWLGFSVTPVHARRTLF
jgi:hypothetical protein